MENTARHRTVVVGARVTVKEKALISERSKSLNMTESEYCRQAALAALQIDPGARLIATFFAIGEERSRLLLVAAQKRIDLSVPANLKAIEDEAFVSGSQLAAIRLSQLSR